MTTRRWIISHRRCWMTVYVLCRNAQLNIIVIIMSYICIFMRSLFVNCPAVICSPNMLVIFYGETPLVNCGPRSNSFTLIKQPQTANCSFFILCNLILIFHTIRLIFCFQQAGKIDNLPVSLGQNSLIVLCADSTSTVQTPINNTIFLAPLTTFWRVAAPTGSITLVSFWGKTCCWTASYLPLGLSQRTCDSCHQALFLAPLTGS